MTPPSFLPCLPVDIEAIYDVIPRAAMPPEMIRECAVGEKGVCAQCPREIWIPEMNREVEKLGVTLICWICARTAMSGVPEEEWRATGEEVRRHGG